MVVTHSDRHVTLTVRELRRLLTRKGKWPGEQPAAYWLIHVLKHLGVARRVGHDQSARRSDGRRTTSHVWRVPASVTIHFTEGKGGAA